jgi:hypothetical protein
MITIIFIIDLYLSDIVDKKYNYTIYIGGFVLLLFFLLTGFFFNKLNFNNFINEKQETLEPSQLNEVRALVPAIEVPAIPIANQIAGPNTSVQNGGNIFSKFFQNKSYSKNSIPYSSNDINNFSEKNPSSIIKNLIFQEKKCELDINDNSYVITFQDMFDNFFKSNKDKDDSVKISIAEPINEDTSKMTSDNVFKENPIIAQTQEPSKENLTQEPSKENLTQEPSKENLTQEPSKENPIIAQTQEPSKENLTQEPSKEVPPV